MDDNVAIIGDWVPPPTPSPRTYFSAIVGGDNISSKSVPGTDRFLSGLQEHMPAANAFWKDVARSGAQSNESALVSGQKFNSHGGLAERMAARAGFNAPRLNTEGIRSAEVQSPFLTIPPGLSPTSLLDSPVFLSNSLAQPSPTTGQFSFFPNLTGKSSGVDLEPPDRSKDNFFTDIPTNSFSFRPVVEPASSGFHNGTSKVNPATLPQQSFPSIEVSVQSEKVQSQAENTSLFQAELSRPIPQKDDITDRRVYDSVSTGTEHALLDEKLDKEIEQRACGDSMLAGGITQSEDGYNWRKYGQKQVKGSEYPRSYYKCTNPDCSVKKKVERSHEGHITEIIYTGAHNHPKPPTPSRPSVGALNLPIGAQSDSREQAVMQTSADVDKVWESMQKGMTTGIHDWKHENVEATPSASNIVHEFSTVHAPHGAHLEPRDAVNTSSTFSNDEDDDDRATHGSTGCEGEGDESDSKRRKIENYASDVGAGNRAAIREPRVVVQTTSEVDILDDGYRWRKYGQKVVKGNPNPRSYYKCTSPGCTVRKHVERASHDLKSVITTYEGKHNHDVPAARNSSHVNSVNSSGGPGQAACPIQTHARRAEPSQVHNNMTRFDRCAGFGAFSFPGRQQLGSIPGVSFGVNPPGLANLAMAGLGPEQAKMQIHPYLALQQQQQCPMIETGFPFPKGEPKVEPLLESSLNLANNPTIYQHQAVMSRLPQL